LDSSPDAPAARVTRLRRHFEIVEPKVILIGEASGYQGCRFSGVPFTSERLVCEGAIPRIAATTRFTTRRLPWSEPSATIVWKTLFALDIAEDTLMWNALPLHPMKTGKPLSNRSPTGDELAAGLPCLQILRDHYPKSPMVAIGLNASKSLT